MTRILIWSTNECTGSVLQRRHVYTFMKLNYKNQNLSYVRCTSSFFQRLREYFEEPFRSNSGRIILKDTKLCSRTSLSKVINNYQVKEFKLMLGLYNIIHTSGHTAHTFQTLDVPFGLPMYFCTSFKIF